MDVAAKDATDIRTCSVVAGCEFASMLRGLGWRQEEETPREIRQQQPLLYPSHLSSVMRN